MLVYVNVCRGTLCKLITDVEERWHNVEMVALSLLDSLVKTICHRCHIVRYEEGLLHVAFSHLNRYNGPITQS